RHRGQGGQTQTVAALRAQRIAHHRVQAARRHGRDDADLEAGAGERGRVLAGGQTHDLIPVARQVLRDAPGGDRLPERLPPERHEQMTLHLWSGSNPTTMSTPGRTYAPTCPSFARR